MSLTGLAFNWLATRVMAFSRTAEPAPDAGGVAAAGGAAAGGGALAAGGGHGGCGVSVAAHGGFVSARRSRPKSPVTSRKLGLMPAPGTVRKAWSRSAKVCWLRL